MSLTSEKKVYSDIKFKKRGGMSTIYEGRDEKLGRKVLFKLMSNKVHDEEDKKNKEILFYREAEILSRVKHENIVEYYNMVRANKQMAICMEFVDGVDLHTLRQNRVLSETEIIDYSIQILNALEYLHGMCIVYRDLKPENVMLDHNGKIRLIDFGLSTFYYGKNDECYYGTAAYAPIEQYRGRVDYRSDIYSLGFTMNYLVTGVNPSVFTLVEMNNIGFCFQMIIERAASQEIIDRYQSPAQMREDLVRYQSIKRKIKNN